MTRDTFGLQDAPDGRPHGTRTTSAAAPQPAEAARKAALTRSDCIKGYLTKAIANSKAVMVSGDLAAYSKLWNEDIRSVGTSLAKLAAMDKGVKDIHTNWLPYTKGDWDGAGKFMTGGVDDPAAKILKVKKAAKELLGLAIKVESEFKARKYWL